MKQSKYNMVSFNIRSLTKNIMTLRDTVKKINTDIIGLQEIWHPHVGFVKIEGYKDLIMKTRPDGKRGGGLGFYLKKHFTYKNIDEINNLKLKKIEVMGIKLITNENETQIINIYRPPDVDTKTTFDDLDLIFRLIENKRTILIGDLNIDVSKKTASQKLT